jgi:hypothetical protein
MSGNQPSVEGAAFLNKPFGPKELLKKTREIIKDPVLFKV